MRTAASVKARPLHVEDSAPGPTGVLFVHGIGEQTESESVRWFAGALLRWLTWWHESRAEGRASFYPEVVSSHLSYGVHNMEGPGRVVINLPGHTEGLNRWKERQWIIAEGWWAARISPPNFAEMVNWARRSAGRAIARLVNQAAFRWHLIGLRLVGRGSRPVGRSDPGWMGALIEFLSTAALLVAYLAALPLAYLVVGLLWLVTLIPIPALRETVFVKFIEPFLVTGLGDFRTYLEDEVQALHIRERLAEDIRWLVEKAGCADLVVVAHSHGTVVAFDALTSGRLPYLEKVRKFITVGAALNNAWKLYPAAARLGGTLPSHIFWLDVWSYYDPVPGGQLVRAGTRPLVNPTDAVMNEMRWREKYVHPERNPGSMTPPTSAMPRETTNGLNVLSDHDGYWRNPEQFLSRLAAEIDLPVGYYARSRFDLPHLWKRSLLRRRRVTTLVGWRLAAMLSFLGGVAARATTNGSGRLGDDGRAIADAVRAIPGSEILGAPAAFVDGMRLWFEGAADAPLGPIADVARGVATFLGAEWWSPLWQVVLALIAFAALFVIAYQLLSHFLWRPWDDDESRASAAVDAGEPNSRWIARSIVVLAAFGTLALVIAQ
jgi:hypothetical protein